jgi:hypothetical protein
MGPISGPYPRVSKAPPPGPIGPWGQGLGQAKVIRENLRPKHTNVIAWSGIGIGSGIGLIVSTWRQHGLG